jgi:drug/metabolite transporter (DMT)-like permease
VQLSAHLLIPFACAFIYVFAALALKRASSRGVGAWRANFIANWMIFAVFLPWWWWQHGVIHPIGDYWQPALTAFGPLLGQTFIFLALNTGDVSVTTPVMGTKVIMVALLTSLLRVGEVPMEWWIGATLSALAVVLLHAGERKGASRHVARTVLLASCSAASYGLGDVLMQKWVPRWGAGSFFPPMFLFVALYSFAFVPLFHAPLKALDRTAWRWVGLGAGLMAINNAGIVIAIGLWGDATAVNIVYSLRGLVSVILVWAIGHWFASEETHLEPRVLRLRFVGAAFMLGAVALVLL